MRSLGISSRLVLLFLMAATPVLLLYVWTALDQRAELRRVAEDQLVRSARLLSSQQLQFFLNARDIMNAALVIADEAAAGPPCNTLLTRVAEANVAFAFIGVATPEGDIFCGSDPALSIDFTGTEAFANAIESGQLAVGMPDDRFLPVAYAPRSEDTEPTAVAIAALDLRSLAETMTLSRLPADAIGVVFDASRSVLARVPTGATIDESVFAPVGPEIANSGGGPGLVEAADLNGRRLWAVADLLPAQGLYVAIGVGVAGLFADADAILWRGIGLLLAVLLIAAFGAWVLGQKTIRTPLARLARSASDMRSGDYSARVPAVSSARELRQLEEDFNSMAGALEVHDDELRSRNARLNELVGEKDTLVREMNHRIKNSLQLVSSLIRLQREDIEDPAAQTGLLDAQTRVAAVAKVHERLYTSERTDRVEISHFLQGLCGDLGRAVEDGSKGRTITVHSDEVELPPDQVVPIGMIVTELVTNAMKHTDAETDGVQVRLEKEGTSLRLTVSDSGSGFPEEFDISKATGLGLRVANGLARQLGGSLEIDRSAPGGRVHVTFDAPIETDKPLAD